MEDTDRILQAALQAMRGRPYRVFSRRAKELCPEPPHQHAACEVHILLAGALPYLVGQEVLQLEPFDMLFIPPGVPHGPCPAQPIAGQPYERLILWIEPVYIRRMSRLFGCDLYRPFDLAWPGRKVRVRLRKAARLRIRQRVEEVLANSASTLPGSDMLVQHQICRLLLNGARWMEQMYSEFDDAPEDQTLHKINQVCRAIQQHCDQKLTLEALAAGVGLNKFYLAHEFKVRMGMTVGRYIAKTRLELACELMAQGHAPTQLYAQCGFAEYSTFYRTFKAEYGISPKKYLQTCPLPPPKA